MKITKHAHACVELDHDGQGIVIDPGTFTPNAVDLIAKASAVLITHEHYDHVHAEALGNALSGRDDIELWGPSAVMGRWADDYPDRVHVVRDGDTFTANGIEVAVHGELHASIHSDVPQVANVGYLVEGSVFHPGDSYHVPTAPVTTLLLPTSGPWTKLAEAVDYTRAVNPANLIQIHELMLSDAGQGSMAMFLNPSMLTAVGLTILPVGESLEV
jgi:L-ascorbate metabolism protein UlaG (beta-lactamase superfamily)